MPNSSPRSNSPARPASLITSAGSSMVWNVPVPSSPLTRRVMWRSAISRRTRAGIASMNCSPCSRRDRFPSSNTFSVPGVPAAAPVMTTGSSSRAGRSSVETGAAAGSEGAPTPAA